MTKIDWTKGDGLVPAIIQDARSGQVLMLGYMNLESFKKTVELNRVTFYSRTKKRLWTKGETSGNFLNVEKIIVDCDSDSLLVLVNPVGATCHTGDVSCFKDSEPPLTKLANTIKDRNDNPSSGSYTASLLSQGINRIAQKVGEEAVEVVIAATNESDQAFSEECADLLYHLLVLLEAKGSEFCEIIEILRLRAISS